MNRNLKVLLIPSDYWSGIGSMAKYLANSEKGVDYYLYTSTEIKHHQKEFMRLVSSVDIVHWLANLSWTKLPPEMDIRKFPVPNIATIHHVDEKLVGYGEKEEATKIAAASQADVIQVVAKEWSDYVQPKTSTPIFLAHYAIDSQQFRTNRYVKRPKQPYRIGTFGFARDMKDRKRVDVLLEAMLILKEKNYDFELVVQGPHWMDLQESFIQQGIKVNNLGYLPFKQALKSYRLLDLYVCSSDVEGGPLPVLEALASGVPVVSTRVGVAIEALSFGGGILVDKGDSAQMAAAIATLMDNSTLYQRLAGEAVQVSENFSWNKIGKEYLSMYQFAINSREPAQAKKPLFVPAKFQRFIQLSKSAIMESPSFKKIMQFKR